MDDGKGHPFVVYMALNKINGDCYIGATEKGTKGRQSTHRWQVSHGGKSHIVFYRALKKYGEENFKFLTIKQCVDYWDALESERAYIALMKPRYNMTSGGGGIKGYKHTPESKAKMSAAKKGKPGLWARVAMPQEIRDRLAAHRRAEKGKPRSLKSQAAALELVKIGNAARRKKVICLNTGVVYLSLTEAGAAYSLTTGQIARLCKLGCATLKGLRFSYEPKQ
jgi:group I intron endonuclease